jgi:hypothetical protein
MTVGRLVVALCVGLALTSCGTDTEPAKAQSTTSPMVTAAPAVLDLSRLDKVADGFPAGYPAQPNPLPGVHQSDAQQAERTGDFISWGKPFTVEPESCRALLKPVIEHAGADGMSVTSATGVQDPFITVAAVDPVSVPSPIPNGGCERFAFVAQGALPDGTAVRLAAPRIDDATTYALRIDYTAYTTASTEPATAEYFYTAILDDRTFVNVWARVPQEFKPEPALPDLLTKAVAAIRGQ